MAGVTVSYSGVHQAYQIARSADEAGILDRFYCSLYDAPKCFGGKLAPIVGQKRLVSRRVEGLDTSKVEEYPWPLIWHELSRSRDWLTANDRFDRHVAKKLGGSKSKIFVGVETCAHHSFEAAKGLGMLNVLDCPGVDAEFLDDVAQKAAAEFGLSNVKIADSVEMRQRKSKERQLADVIFTCSEFQLNTMRSIGNQSAKRKIIPLWIDQDFWKPASSPRNIHRPLRVLFVGKISIRKGVPYLLEAAKACANNVKVTLVGNVDPDVTPLLKSKGNNASILPPRPKTDLREIYQAHDVFALPSLGDAFGIAALEAMASALPVIVTDHCGVPVPDESWRVTAMNSEAIAARLMFYAKNRDVLKADAEAATRFASRFTPEKYREEIRNLLNMTASRAPHAK